MTEKEKKSADDRGSLKLPPPLHKEISHEAVERGIARPRLIAEMWQLYKTARSSTDSAEVPPQTFNTGLNRTPPTGSNQTVISSGLSPEFTEEHRQLEKILRGGVADEAIKHNLEAFARLTELEHGQGNPDPGESGPDFKPGMEQLRASAERARRRLQDSKDAGEGIRPKKTKPLKKASGGS